jgi:acetylornithine deacetylase/succinyl-diaminopimelate desuccinylase-like protein
MQLRHDALAGAAELILAAENCGVLATVGKLEVAPGASNVIPGHISLTLDVRDPKDSRRLAAVRALQKKGQAIAKRRGLKIIWQLVQQTAAVQCDRDLMQIFANCIAQRGLKVIKLPSGAGHDAAALSTLCPVVMLFVRCQGGISHHPAEFVKTADAQTAIAILADFIRTLAKAD